MKSRIFGELLQVEPHPGQAGNAAGFSQDDLMTGSSDFPFEMAPFRFQCLQLLTGNGKPLLLGEQIIQECDLPVYLFEKFGTIRLGGMPRCKRFRILFFLLLTFDKSLFVGRIAERRSEKTELVFDEFLQHVVGRSIVVRNDQHRFPGNENVGDDVQYGLRLAGSGRALNDADRMLESLLYGFQLACIAAERIDQPPFRIRLRPEETGIEIGRQCRFVRHETDFVVLFG